jgi:Carboxypeptidase regulatory-like domain
MTRAASDRKGISRQRGFWLRCFLGRTMVLLALTFCLGRCACANVCVYKTLHVMRVRGHVTDYLGDKIPGAKLTFKKDGKTSLESAADEQGAFNLKVPRGKYWLSVEAPGFAPGRAYLQVGFGFKSLFHSSSLHMILSPGVICEYRQQEVRQAEPRPQS